MSIFSHFQQRFEATRQEEYSLQEYLDLCKQDPTTYASAAERMLMAIGEPQMIDTATDPRLSRIFANKVIRRYPAFADFHGMEDCIEQIVSYFRHAGYRRITLLAKTRDYCLFWTGCTATSQRSGAVSCKA